ncbi:hypothetical protein CEXT_637921 [Caerostris extrusa]|uniref:Secreted protein n=1 Tax=Caerostris extrusa TaxID=172846 RepID=A0AAV4PA13_CAEEX|nr:hypothetical protein CEXT_637921 [Caerostris extrusa]
MFRISNSSLVRFCCIRFFILRTHTEGRLQRSIIWSAFRCQDSLGVDSFFFSSHVVRFLTASHLHMTEGGTLYKQVFNLLIGCPSLAWAPLRNGISADIGKKPFFRKHRISGVSNRSFTRWTG